MLSALEIMDILAREFKLVQLKRNIDKIDNPEQLRGIAKDLLDIMETQRRTFNELVFGDSDYQGEQGES